MKMAVHICMWCHIHLSNFALAAVTLRVKDLAKVKVRQSCPVPAMKVCVKVDIWLYTS